MKHYRIKKKTCYGLNDQGELETKSRFLAYKRFLWILWDRLMTIEAYSCGWMSTSSVGFDSLEAAENFVKSYHNLRNKVGKYTLEVVENINLE